jgi:hypothetical protein
MPRSSERRSMNWIIDLSRAPLCPFYDPWNDRISVKAMGSKDGLTSNETLRKKPIITELMYIKHTVHREPATAFLALFR